ncbi:MAG: glutathione S-transferase family protein [Pseudomonadota bacterium]|nr:glutathione S-transferase family protein [Pseudomonadota bacterium]
MKLYYDPITVNCRKVVAGLDLIGASYDEELVSYFGGEHKLPAYTSINPNAELPALVDGELKLWESNAILVYASEKLGNTTVYPADPKVRADITRWLLWESGKWFSTCYTYLVENVVKVILDDTPDEAVLADHAPTFHARASILEAALDGRDWLSDDHATIADIAMAAPMHLHGLQKLPLEDYPNIRAWMERVEALPCWQKSDPVPHLPPEVLAKFA